MSALGSMSPAAIAGRVVDHLEAIDRTLKRLLELNESTRKNALGSGSVPGGGTAMATPVMIIKANPNRRGLMVSNTAASGLITVGLGITAPASGQGLVIQPGQSWDGRISGGLWLGSVSVVGSSSSVSYSWLEA